MLWLSGIACNGNTHSFLNYPKLEYFLKNFEFIYHPIIESKYSLTQIVETLIPCDILIIEGSVSKDFERANISILDTIFKYGKVVKKIVTVGTCASFGGIFKESGDNITGLHFDGTTHLNIFKEFQNKTISVSGCPIHPETLASTLFEIKDDIEIKLDMYLRPKEIFAYTIHNGCTRNEYFEYKIDNHIFGKKEGCMFYDNGCQAPFTSGSCNKNLWNDVSSKTRSGSPCFGCTEPEFPKRNLFATKKNMGIPQFLPKGISKRAYLTIAGVTKAFTIDRLEKGLLDD
ncbi:MAG: hydrogenase [Arcobacter sp.]|nr:hydrogenase [Arcobacter sp.]